MNKLLKYLTLAAAVAGFSATMAYAEPELYVTDGLGNFVYISDNHLVNTPGIDQNAAVGKVSWAGTIGTWAVDVAFGITYPSIGSLTNPSMDSTFNVTGAGTLWFYFAADGFGPTSGSPMAKIGGTTGGTVTYNVYGGNSNMLFDSANLLTSEGPFGVGSFSGSVTGVPINSPAPFSLMQQLIIHQDTSSNSSGDSLLTVPDAGSTLLLLGAALTGLALIGRRQKRAS